MIDRVKVVTTSGLVGAELEEGFEGDVAAGVVDEEVPVLLESLAKADTGRRERAITEATNIRFMSRGYDLSHNLVDSKTRILPKF